MSELIVINFKLYRCKDGTNDKITAALKEAEKASPIDHEAGRAYDNFDDILWGIVENQKGKDIENVYRTS